MTKPALLTSAFKLQPVVTNRWVISPAAGVTLEDVQDPAFFTHIAARLTPGDIIEVHPETSEYWAELMVRSASRTEANVYLLRHASFDAVEAPEVTPVTVMWRGPAMRYSLMRGQTMVSSGFQTKEEAIRAIGAHDKEFAA